MAFFSFLPVQKAAMKDLLFAKPRVYVPLMNYAQAVMRQKSELSIDDKELIAAYVSALNGCDFCYDMHAYIATQYDISEKKLKSLVENIETADITENKKSIFKYVKKITLTPQKVVQSDINGIMKAGWKEKTAHDVLHIAALFAAFNRIADGAGLPPVKQEDKKNFTSFVHKLGYLPWYVKPLFNLMKIFKK